MGKDNKLHIILLGRRNSGKSSLINALTGQNIAIVSDVAGTTRDKIECEVTLDGEHEQQLAEQLKKLEIPFLVIHNKRDESDLTPVLKEKLTTTYNCPVIDYSTREDNTDLILNTLKSIWKKDNTPKSLIGDLLSPGDIVLLITPIDSEAPAGRLILPQVQMIRDILDNHCTSSRKWLPSSPQRSLSRVLVSFLPATKETLRLISPGLPG